MMRIFLLMAGNDWELAELLKLKAATRSAIRAMGANHVQVKYKRRWYKVVAPTSGGICLTKVRGVFFV